MNVSKRLNRLAEMVTEGNRLADVGTDHGYVPILLMNEKKIPSAIAMDVNKGPLLRAESHIAEYGLKNYIETRLSDGLQALKPGEADTVLIAGMGGALTVRILENGLSVLETVKELVLQPQSEIAGVRQWLGVHGFVILEEDILLEEGKYYPMMKAVPGTMQGYTPAEYRFGKWDLQRSPKVLREFWEKSLKVQEEIKASLPASQEARILERQREVEAEESLLRGLLEECI